MRRDNLRAMVGAAALETRNRWISVAEISYLTDASARQISAILSQIPGIQMESQHAEWGRSIMIIADDEEAKRIWGHLMKWRYHIDDVYDLLESCMPSSGWMSIRDLSSDTGMMQSDVLKCIAWMGDEVILKGSKRQMMCRRAGDNDVSECVGDSVAGDSVAEQR
ncbi:TPA_asm: hypothetical protein vir335_00018 [Classicovirus victor]|uniref:Uncharacterized protein n=1 Tax=Caudoviricetes sp. vir335 TaxID=3068357 RepID=A0AA87CDC6_9CAUD|nr:TPA_asm: hypothetical protein vir335_00018 [Caudoviricetes sp. vir335]